MNDEKPEKKITLPTPPAAVKLPHPGALAVSAVRNMIARGKGFRANELDLLNQVLGELKKTNPALVARYVEASEEFQIAMNSAGEIVELLQDGSPPADEADEG